MKEQLKLQRGRERMARLRNKRRLQGLCDRGCGNIARPGIGRCTECAEKHRTMSAQYRNRLKRQGLCVAGCGALSRLGYVLCLECSKKVYTAQKARRDQLKSKAVKYKGEKCEECGLKTEKYLSVYEFHHEDPNTKEGTVADLIKEYQSWKVIKKELDKCRMLCANCHRIQRDI